MNLDSAVACAVARAHLLETALHSRSAWYIEIGGQRALANRQTDKHGVSFVACFDDVAADATIAALHEGRSMRAVRTFEHPGAGPFCLSWALALEESVPA